MGYILPILSQIIKIILCYLYRIYLPISSYCQLYEFIKMVI